MGNIQRGVSRRGGGEDDGGVKRVRVVKRRYEAVRAMVVKRASSGRGCWSGHGRKRERMAIGVDRERKGAPQTWGSEIRDTRRRDGRCNAKAKVEGRRTCTAEWDFGSHDDQQAPSPHRVIV